MTLNSLIKGEMIHTNKAFSFINWKKNPRVENKEARGKNNNTEITDEENKTKK